MDKRILLVDDDRDYTSLMAIFFKNLNADMAYKIEYDAPSAIEYLENCKLDDFPTAILVDMNMPFHDGFYFLQAFEEKFRDIFPNTKIFMVTGSIDAADHKKAWRYESVTEVLKKPLSRDVLKDILV